MLTLNIFTLIMVFAYIRNIYTLLFVIEINRTTHSPRWGGCLVSSYVLSVVRMVWCLGGPKAALTANISEQNENTIKKHTFS